MLLCAASRARSFPFSSSLPGSTCSTKTYSRSSLSPYIQCQLPFCPLLSNRSEDALRGSGRLSQVDGRVPEQLMPLRTRWTHYW